MIYFKVVLALFYCIVCMEASCPYFKENDATTSSINDMQASKFRTNTPSCKKTGDGLVVVNSEYTTCVAFKNIKSEFVALLPNSSAKKTDILAKALRLAFHDAAEYDLRTDDKFGPDGCLSNNDHNAGMMEEDSIVMTIFEPLWQKYCDQMSRADFYATIGALAVEVADPTNTISIPKKWGRVDAESCSTEGRLPEAQKGLDMIQSIFVDQLGLTMNDAITLIGGHTIGHVHPQFSNYGYSFHNHNASDILVNAWDMTPHLFDNEYYKSVINVAWGAGGNYRINPNITDKSKTLWAVGVTPIIALNSDMAIGFDINFEYNGRSLPDFLSSPFVGGQLCTPIDDVTNQPIGTNQNTSVPRGCYITPKNSPFFYYSGQAPTYCLVAHYADHNDAFLEAFSTAYDELTSVGYSFNGKLGSSLQTINMDIC